MENKTGGKETKPPKGKPPKEKKPGRGRMAVALAALLLGTISLAGVAYFGFRAIQSERAQTKIAGDYNALKGQIEKLEQAAALEKNRESVVIQLEPHGLTAYMTDSKRLYQTLFSGVRYESNPEAAGAVKLRVPLSVTIYNNSEQTITIQSAALYPWETIFEETAVREPLAARQKSGFFGSLDQGQRDRFSVAPGASYSLEIDARLRGVYTHPALEAEMSRFFMEYFDDPEHAAPSLEGDSAIEGKGVVNGQVNYLYRKALAYYCTQRSTRFTLTYSIKTARGNTFSASCAVPV
ncbi:MAG: hypothetical protein LBG83_02480 [Oscillospiraceae bacterium]|jgi:hypothetical protein|nr:hypothetical protein [Oscillospiraceae bacterium]